MIRTGGLLYIYTWGTCGLPTLHTSDRVSIPTVDNIDLSTQINHLQVILHYLYDLARVAG